MWWMEYEKMAWPPIQNCISPFWAGIPLLYNICTRAVISAAQRSRRKVIKGVQDSQSSFPSSLMT